MDPVELRALVPRVLSVLVGRGADFATAEDAVQEALIKALDWGDPPPRDPTGWLVTVAWRSFLDQARSTASRRAREERFDAEPLAGAVPSTDDTLGLYFLCAHPDLSPSSAVALTLRAVGGLTTRQISAAYLVPEATMAQRISRAKRTVAAAGLDRPGDVSTVMQVLYLVFNEGYSGEVDLAAEAIRLTRQLAEVVDDPEVHGLLALMLLHQARRPSRVDASGRLVPLAEQDRSRWDTDLIVEGVEVLQAALLQDRLVIQWALRMDADDCGGAIMATGEVQIRGGANWQPSLAAAQFEVPAAQFTANTTVEVRLVVNRNPNDPVTNGLFGRFDALTLTVSGAAIFRDGFE